ncbi:hypothetical protein AK812_SmicGene22154 [Symbiodinium microadriaticum]|uniref:Uncharacterized protein n=1 Tax=Symbiodinium microadriaticum TaxID=2951 RepID=A0A1Q9DKL9_SYMMI|nr:hypothetical protein AK812_SmicGene22154 [Symbiodinium microadriaticum]
MLPVASPLPSRAVTPKSVATSKSLKVATHGGDLDLEEFILATASMPVASLRGDNSGGTKMAVGGPDSEEMTSSKNLGRYATPSCGVNKIKGTGSQTPRRHSDAPKPTGLSPSPPTSPHSGRPRGSVRRSPRAGEVKSLSTEKLGVILRRRRDTPDPSDRNQENDDEKSGGMAMTKAKTDMSRSFRNDDQPEVEVRKMPSKQEQLVSRLLHSDEQEVAVSRRDRCSPEGSSSNQKKRLDGRRRSRELQALLNSMEDQDGTTAVGDEVPHDDSGMDHAQNKEDNYWSAMWHMTKDMMNTKGDPKEDEQVPTIGISEPRLEILLGL